MRLVAKNHFLLLTFLSLHVISTYYHYYTPALADCLFYILQDHCLLAAFSIYSKLILVLDILKLFRQLLNLLLSFSFAVFNGYCNSEFKLFCATFLFTHNLYQYFITLFIYFYIKNVSLILV